MTSQLPSADMETENTWPEYCTQVQLSANGSSQENDTHPILDFIAYSTLTKATSARFTSTHSVPYTETTLNDLLTSGDGSWTVCKWETTSDLTLNNAKTNERGYVTLQKKMRNRYGEELTVRCSTYELRPLSLQEHNDLMLRTRSSWHTTTNGASSKTSGITSTPNSTQTSSKRALIKASLKRTYGGLKSSKIKPTKLEKVSGLSKERLSTLWGLQMSEKQQQSESTQDDTSSESSNQTAAATIPSQESTSTILTSYSGTTSDGETNKND